MISSNPNHLPNTTTLGVRTLTHAFGGDTNVQSITVVLIEKDMLW